MIYLIKNTDTELTSTSLKQNILPLSETKITVRQRRENHSKSVCESSITGGIKTQVSKQQGIYDFNKGQHMKCTNKNTKEDFLQKVLMKNIIINPAC